MCQSQQGVAWSSCRRAMNGGYGTAEAPTSTIAVLSVGENVVDAAVFSWEERRMRETLKDAAARLLNEPLGTERKILINVNDGLTGLPPGDPRFARTKTMSVRVDEQTKDGRRRRVVTELGKSVVVATGPWSAG